MGRRNVLILLIVVVLFAQASASSRVEIFYETHCPDSQHLMRNGLAKSLEMLPEVDFVLVPYGKASTSGQAESLSFKCQHGPAECEGNTYHACALELHKDKEQTLRFAICTMSHGQAVLDKIESCANTNGLNYAELKSCATSQMGKDLLARMGELTQTAAKKITGQPRLSFVPSTIIDGEPLVYEAYNNLRKAICNSAKQKPSQC